jgi:hypothetical protein
MHRRLRLVAHAVGQYIGEMDGIPADHREFYWQQTAPIHHLSPTDPLARGLWAEAFGDGYRQGVARRRQALQQDELPGERDRLLGASDV